MLCQNCRKRIANIHLVKTVNGSKIRVHLCEQCAKEKSGTEAGADFNYSDFFSGLMNFNPEESPDIRQMCKPVCGRCGLSWEEFQKKGKLGCSQCYKLYGGYLNPLLKRLHGNVKHTGKVPQSMREELLKTREVEELKLQLNKAVREEEYEKAAELRDRIKLIETGSK